MFPIKIEVIKIFNQCVQICMWQGYATRLKQFVYNIKKLISFCLLSPSFVRRFMKLQWLLDLLHVLKNSPMYFQTEFS